MRLDCECISALVIADDASAVRNATEDIEAYRLHIVANPDPRAALETARSKVFDVVLFDAQLFRSEVGAEFASFRAIPSLCRVALVVEGDALERVRWLDAGADDCLSVPCNPPSYSHGNTLPSFLSRTLKFQLSAASTAPLPQVESAVHDSGLDDKSGHAKGRFPEPSVGSCMATRNATCE